MKIWLLENIATWVTKVVLKNIWKSFFFFLRKLWNKISMLLAEIIRNANRTQSTLRTPDKDSKAGVWLSWCLRKLKSRNDYMIICKDKNKINKNKNPFFFLFFLFFFPTFTSFLLLMDIYFFKSFSFILFFSFSYSNPLFYFISFVSHFMVSHSPEQFPIYPFFFIFYLFMHLHLFSF